MNLQDWTPGPTRKVFLGGAPKSAGKTTFAMTAPGKKLILQYDLGNPTIPPGVDPSSCWFRSYPPEAPRMVDPKGEYTDKWQKPTNVGKSILADIDAVVQGFLHSLSSSAPPMITFPDGESCPLPDVLILDGMTELATTITEGVLGMNKKMEADDFSNNFALWQKRLTIMRGILHQLIPLPCSVILIGWEIAETETINRQQQKTGKVVPDIGGKLDNMLPGKCDAALRCYSTSAGKEQEFWVQTQSDGIRDWVGIRGQYNLSPKVNVTITGKPGEKSPWERVFPTR